MQFSQEHNNSAHVIRSYDEKSIEVIQPINEEMLIEADYEPDKVNDLRLLSITNSMVICHDQVLPSWPPESVEELKPEHIEALLELQPEIVIIGTGKQLKWPHPQIMQPLIQNHIGYEVMTTPSACRTYNVLMHEDRRVVAALII